MKLTWTASETDIDKYFYGFCAKHDINRPDDQEFIRMVLLGKSRKDTCLKVCNKDPEWCIAAKGNFCRIKDDHLTKPFANEVYGNMKKYIQRNEKSLAVLGKRLALFKKELIENARKEFEGATKENQVGMYQVDQEVESVLVTIKDTMEDSWSQYVRERKKEEGLCSQLHA